MNYGEAKKGMRVHIDPRGGLRPDESTTGTVQSKCASQLYPYVVYVRLDKPAGRIATVKPMWLEPITD